MNWLASSQNQFASAERITENNCHLSSFEDFKLVRKGHWQYKSIKASFYQVTVTVYTFLYTPLRSET
jgi:hypothetical protein